MQRKYLCYFALDVSTYVDIHFYLGLTQSGLSDLAINCATVPEKGHHHDNHTHN